MIEDRDYLKQELADAVYAERRNIKPESRMKALWREVNGCPELVEELRRLRWKPKGWGVTRRQVMAIKDFLCID